MFIELKNIRNKLLIENELDFCSDFISFFDEASNEAKETLLSKLPSSLAYDEINSLLCDLIDYHNKNNIAYYNQIIYGQKIIWNEVLNCFTKISNNLKITKELTLAKYEDNYTLSVDEIKTAIYPYASSLALLSKLEDILGVDRYLDTVCESDFIPLQSLVEEQAKLLENKLKYFKDQFQRKWSNTNVTDILLHKFISRSDENTICSSLASGENTILLFVIDGFGFCQYEWQKHYLNDFQSFTYNENIYSWLSDEGCSSELILGAPFITDTAAGLSQIFIGIPSYESGMISSNVKPKSSPKVVQTKSLNRESINKYFNTTKNSVTEVLSTLGINSKIYYHTKFDSFDSGFSSYLYKGSVLDSDVPQDRIFMKLLEDLDSGIQGLRVIYLTGIDNSGHTLGAFSKFERYEHAKLQSLLKNFIIELAQKESHIFNGKTTILLTADHGMTETARKFISRSQLDDLFKSNDIWGTVFAIDNRAVLIYNVSDSFIEKAKSLLVEFFKNQDIAVEIFSNIDVGFLNFFPADAKGIDNFPDIVVRMIGNGLFVVNQAHAMTRHLMHFGGHGGSSINEVFVPLVEINLNQKLMQCIQEKFIKLS